MNDLGVPKTIGSYMKFNKEGDFRFRVLSDYIVGWESWVDKKPIRWEGDYENPPSPDDIDSKGGDPEKIKHFWAFIVWNYEDEAVQILEITQKTIMRSLIKYHQDEDWGDFKEYDIVVSRSGMLLEDTEYSTIPKPKKPVASDIKEAYAKKPIDLTALYRGADPFVKEEIDYPDGDGIDPKDIPF